MEILPTPFTSACLMATPPFSRSSEHHCTGSAPIEKLRPTGQHSDMIIPTQADGAVILHRSTSSLGDRSLAMRETWTFHSAGKLLFGRNAVRQLGDVAAWVGAKRVLIVTDPVLAKAGTLERIRVPLAESSVSVESFTEGEPEPSMRAAEACISLGRKFKPDAVLGLGGGSNMDLAKITAAILAHGGTPRDYVGDDKIPGPVWPLICVPT